MLPSGQGWPDFVGDCEIHDHHGAAENQMEMRSHPRGVVDHGVHAVTVVNDPAETAKPQHHEGEAGGQNHGTVPRQGVDPAEYASPTPKSACDFKGCSNRKNRRPTSGWARRIRLDL